jgi:hypothetical protein
MGIYTAPNDGIEGRRIICEFEDRALIHDKGDYVEASIKGNLAKAVVVRIWQLKS